MVENQRQLVLFLIWMALSGIQQRMWQNHGIRPVSYTHLDVYKRQARDFMIGKGFTYCIPPFMIRSNVVTGVMSFEEMDCLLYTSKV